MNNDQNLRKNYVVIMKSFSDFRLAFHVDLGTPRNSVIDSILHSEVNALELELVRTESALASSSHDHIHNFVKAKVQFRSCASPQVVQQRESTAMIFSRAWFALMRRNLVYRQRHWLATVSLNEA